MTREQLKAAADALGRLEALEAAIASADRAPHDAFPISFLHLSAADRHTDEHGIKAYYPRLHYFTTLGYLIANEQAYIESVGVEL